MSGRLVVFGAGGFIGSALVAGLERQLVAPSRAEVDLTDADRLRAFLRPGDTIVNASGYASATDRSALGRARFRRDNVEAVRTLAQAASATGAVRLVHFSSVAAMGHREGEDLQEHDLATPRSPYGQSKRDAELILEEAADRLPITILRPTSVFGERRGLAGVLCRIAALPVVPLPGGGRALIPFTYVGNVVAAVKLTLDRPNTAGRTFIVGDDRSYRLREVLASLAGALRGERPPMVSVPAAAIRGIGAIEGVASRATGRSPLLDPVRIETLMSSISYSTRSFREATGFRPPVTLDAAMALIAAWYRGEHTS
jgi:nucleoside-diphosphate-sugar epimerase